MEEERGGGCLELLGLIFSVLMVVGVLVII